jgi:hypothetical protein
MTRGTREAKETRKEFRNICGKGQDDIIFANGYPSTFIMQYILRKRNGVVIPDNELANLLKEAELAEERAEQEAEAVYQANVAAHKAKTAAAIEVAAAAIEAQNATLIAAAPIYFTVSIRGVDLNGNIIYSSEKGLSLEWLDLSPGMMRGEDEFFCDADGICIFSSLIEFSDLLSIIFVKLSLDGENPIIQSWVITLPRMAHWQDVVLRRFNKVESLKRHLNASLLFAVVIDDSIYEMQLLYDSKGYTDKMDCKSMPLYATSKFEASDDASDKQVGEVVLIDPYFFIGSIKECIFEC